MDRRACGGEQWGGNGHAVTELVRLTDITKVYQGGVTGALNGVSIAIEEGEFTAVVGPAGRGKSAPPHPVAGPGRPTRRSRSGPGPTLAAPCDAWPAPSP